MVTIKTENQFVKIAIEVAFPLESNPNSSLVIIHGIGPKNN